MTLSACGVRWTDAQRADVLSRTRNVAAADLPAARGASTNGSSADAAAPSSGEVTSATVAGTTRAAGAISPTKAATAGRSLPCAAPSDAPGVTKEQITIASISSRSGPVPGLGSSAAAAVRSYVAFRNATGGVCGRKLVLKEADDGTDSGRYRSLITQLAPDVLGVAGGFALGDVGAVDLIEKANLPLVNVTSSDIVTAAPSVFDINPPYANLDTVIGKYRYLHDHGATKASVVYLAVDQSRAEAQNQERLMKAAGIAVVQVQELPVSTLSYDSAARSVANSGADYLLALLDTHGNVSMAQSMQDSGYKTKFSEYLVFAYATQFIDQAGPAAEGATTWLRALPNEEAGGNPEMAAFVQWMDQVAPDDVRDTFAADSWTGAKAFLDALQALPGPISRAALVAQLKSVDSYDAGGMMGPIHLGPKHTEGCFIGMRVVSGQWRRMAPDHGYLC